MFKERQRKLISLISREYGVGPTGPVYLTCGPPFYEEHATWDAALTRASRLYICASSNQIAVYYAFGVLFSSRISLVSSLARGLARLFSR